MTLPTHVRTTVSQAAITKVTRLFNGTIGDVLAELLQNARRAGATTVHIEVLDHGDRQLLSVRDDGAGIVDPEVIVTLGRSGWGEDLARREDPAGMGMFSLAGRYVEVSSRTAGARRGWSVVIEPDAWEASAPIAVEPAEMGRGTEIIVELTKPWADGLAAAVAGASMFYPLPVHFLGVEQVRRDWLGDATHVENWNGTRIGVIRHGRNTARGKRINFHGVTVACSLPSIGEQDGGHSWTTLVDVVDAPALQLVLPARKEMVQNDALAELRIACKRAIFNAIAKSGTHRLGFADWSEARDLGVGLPEAEAYLFGWLPPSNDSGYMGQQGEQIRDAPMLVMPDLEPDVGNSAYRALADGKALGATIVLEEPAFEGYSWYDAIPKIEDVQFVVAVGDETHRLFADDRPLPPSIQTGHVQDIYVRLSFAAEAKPVTYIPTDVLIIDYESCGILEDVIILLKHDTAITVGQLTELLQRGVFCDSDDKAADSYETQEADFARHAHQVAMTLLLGEERAILARIEELLRHEARFLQANARTVAVTLADGAATARYVEAQPLPATPA